MAISSQRSCTLCFREYIVTFKLINNLDFVGPLNEADKT